MISVHMYAVLPKGPSSSKPKDNPFTGVSDVSAALWSADLQKAREHQAKCDAQNDPNDQDRVPKSVTSLR